MKANYRVPKILIAAIVAVLVLWAFLAIASLVVSGGSLGFDKAIVLAMRQEHNPVETIGPHWLQQAAISITALGNVANIVLVVAIASGFLLLVRRVEAFTLLLLSTLGAAILNFSLKSAFARERPDVVRPLVEVSNYGFPSGHALMSAVIYLTLAVLIARETKSRAAKIYIIIVAIVLTFLIGLTRVFVGVHYPTDVLAGWTLGLAWALTCWMLEHARARRRALRKGEYVPQDDSD